LAQKLTFCYGYIYVISNIVNKKLYIGKSCFNNPNYFGSGIAIRCAITKYNRDKFKKIIISFCETKEELNLAERECIWFFQSNNKIYGYNLTEGGDGGCLNPEALIQMSLKHKGKKHTEEYKKELSKRMKGLNLGENNGQYGKVPWNFGLTKETSELVLKSSETFKLNYIKENHPNYKKEFSEETKNKMSISMRGKAKTLEHRHKLSIVNLGKTLSIETREKMSKSKSGISQDKVTCPYCGKVGGTTMYRWHFENCKNKIGIKDE